MKYASIFIYFLFLGLCNCEKEMVNNQENILGDWDIKGGGTLFIETDSFSYQLGVIRFLGKLELLKIKYTFL